MSGSIGKLNSFIYDIYIELLDLVALSKKTDFYVPTQKFQ